MRDVHSHRKAITHAQIPKSLPLPPLKPLRSHKTKAESSLLRELQSDWAEKKEI